MRFSSHLDHQKVRENALQPMSRSVYGVYTWLNLDRVFLGGTPFWELFRVFLGGTPFWELFGHFGHFG